MRGMETCPFFYPFSTDSPVIVNEFEISTRFPGQCNTMYSLILGQSHHAKP